MSYVVSYKGVEITVESLDDAADLTRKLVSEEKPSHTTEDRTRNDGNPTQEESLVETSGPTFPEKLRAFWRDIAAPERRLLAALAREAGRLGTDELAAAAEIEATDLKYSFKRIYSRAKSHGISGRLLVVGKQDTSVRPVKSLYWMNEKVKKGIIELSASEPQT